MHGIERFRLVAEEVAGRQADLEARALLSGQYTPPPREGANSSPPLLKQRSARGVPEAVRQGPGAVPAAGGTERPHRGMPEKNNGLKILGDIR